MTEHSEGAVLEIVSFRLQAGTTPTAFLHEARNTDALLRRCPGFVRRLLVEDQGQWSDLVEWADRASAMAAAEAVMREPAFAPFMAMIDAQTASMGHHAIRARTA